MRKKAIDVADIYYQLAGGPEDGVTLELIQADDKGNEINTAPYPLATIVAGKGENLFLEVYPKEGIYRIPITNIQKAIEIAEGKVRSEAFFDKQRTEDLDAQVKKNGKP